MSWRQSKRVRRYTLDKSESLRRSLLSKHWFWLSHGAREISFNFVRYQQGKNRLHQFYQSKAFDGRRKTHWKQRNISFLEKWRFGFIKRTTTSVIYNVSAYSTDSITPDLRLRKGYRFLIRCHSRLQTFSKQRCMLLCDSSPTVIFISVFIRLIAYQRRFSN